MRFLSPLLFAAAATAVQADVPRVATDIAPVHGLVARVMEGVGTPDLVIPPGASPHGYAMRPSEADALAQADVVFWIGPVLSPWLEDPIETLAESALHVTLSDQPGVTVLEYREGARFAGHDHDHGDGHAEENHDDHDHAEEKHDDHGHDHAAEKQEGHDHGHDKAEAVKDEHGHDHHDAEAFDAHLWLSPENAILWLDAIADTLADLDTENEGLYRANAAAASEEIAALTKSLETRLEPAQGRPFVVFHDAYHYFEARFGVEAVAAVTLGDEGPASAAHLAEVREVVRETGAVCALAEPRANVGLLDAVTEGSDLRIATVDAIGVDLEPGPRYYTELLSQIGERLLTCLVAES